MITRPTTLRSSATRFLGVRISSLKSYGRNARPVKTALRLGRPTIRCSYTPKWKLRSGRSIETCFLRTIKAMVIPTKIRVVRGDLFRFQRKVLDQTRCTQLLVILAKPICLPKGGAGVHWSRNSIGIVRKTVFTFPRMGRVSLASNGFHGKTKGLYL